ncbi:MAG: hypothetical protein ABI251_04475, partial [Mycobacteriaceae bacterium]
MPAQRFGGTEIGAGADVSDVLGTGSTGGRPVGGAVASGGVADRAGASVGGGTGLPGEGTMVGGTEGSAESEADGATTAVASGTPVVPPQPTTANGTTSMISAPTRHLRSLRFTKISMPRRFTGPDVDRRGPPAKGRPGRAP